MCHIIDHTAPPLKNTLSTNHMQNTTRVLFQTLNWVNLVWPRLVQKCPSACVVENGKGCIHVNVHVYKITYGLNETKEIKREQFNIWYSGFSKLDSANVHFICMCHLLVDSFELNNCV